MQQDENKNKTNDKNKGNENNIKKWIAILAVLIILLLAGIYTYYNYLKPETTPGTAGEYIIEDDENGGVSYIVEDEDGEVLYIADDEDGEIQYRVENENGKVRHIIEDEDGEELYVIESEDEETKYKIKEIEGQIKKEISILLVGLDDEESVEKGDVEADSIYLAELNTEAKNITLTAFQPMEEINNGKLKIYNTGQLLDNIEDMMDKDIDYYFSMSYEGFERIVDELGGIEVRLDTSLEVSDLGLYLNEGKNLLSGKEALNYARFYDYDKNGIERIQRQQKVIDSIYNKVTQTNMLLNIPAIFRSIVETFKSVDTDMDTQLIVELISYLRNRNDFDLEYEIYSLE